jgi:hypothetical protein
MKTIEQRMRDMERGFEAVKEMVSEIHARIVLGKKIVPGKAEFDRAIEAIMRGDNGPMDIYLQRGGELPALDRPYKPYTPRKRVERPQAEPTNGCGPVMQDATTTGNVIPGYKGHHNGEHHAGPSCH